MINKATIVALLLVVSSCSKGITSKNTYAKLPSLELANLEPVRLKKFSFVEAKCYYQYPQRPLIESYACLEKKDLEALLYNMQSLKVRNGELLARLSAYSSYYEGSE